MRIGIISDAHANVASTKQCLEFLVNSKAVDDIYFLGDFVGYFLKVNETIDLLKSYNVKCISGNHDAMLTGKLNTNEESAKVYLLGETKKIITDENFQYLNNLEPFRDVEIDNRLVKFVHGTPSDKYTGYFYPDSDTSLFQNEKEQVIFMGHTHWPFVRKTENGKLLVNPGSCGLPRDAGNLASLAVYDSNLNDAKIFRIKMDIEKIKLENQYIHSSVSKCLERTTKDFVGELIS